MNGDVDYAVYAITSPVFGEIEIFVCGPQLHSMPRH